MNEYQATQRPSLLEFPCQFPIKAMGKCDQDFELLVVSIIRRHVDELLDSDIHTRPSKGGNYLAVTVTIQAQSQAQLDTIYYELSGHPKIVMVL